MIIIIDRAIQQDRRLKFIEEKEERLSGSTFQSRPSLYVETEFVPRIQKRKRCVSPENSCRC